jgi:predicted phosphoadenosine phosphosulfate sulfurtransferase
MVEAYAKIWEDRCYSSGIPEEVPKKLADSGRVPSYKSIAIAFLKNDLKLRSLGFVYSDTSELSDMLYRKKKESDSSQLMMF